MAVGSSGCAITPPRARSRSARVAEIRRAAVSRTALRRSCGAPAAVTLVSALAACTPQPIPVPAAEPLHAGIHVELFQLRSDVAERGAQVRVINGSDIDLVITSLTFADDWFVGEAVRDRTSTIPAGRAVDLRFDLPESACEDEPDAASRTSRVTLDLEGGGTATVDVADLLGFTTLIHQKECLRHDLARVATLKWTAFTPSAAPLPAELQLGTTPSGGTESAALVEVQTTNLPQFADQPAPFLLALTVTGTDAATLLSVPIVPLRCDPHAVNGRQARHRVQRARRGRRRLRSRRGRGPRGDARGDPPLGRRPVRVRPGLTGLSRPPALTRLSPQGPAGSPARRSAGRSA